MNLRKVVPLFYILFLITFIFGMNHENHMHETTEIGEFIITHHEAIYNPTYNSSFKVSMSCMNVQTPCNWESPSTWSQGSIPDLDSRIILNGNVQINDENAVASDILIYPNGSLIFNPNENTKLLTKNLIVGPKGYLEIGTQSNPIKSNVKAELVLRDAPFYEKDIKQHLNALLSEDGIIRIHGDKRDESFIEVSENMYSGDNQVKLQKSALDANWKVGDSIVIPHSAQCLGDSSFCRPKLSESEDFTITDISSNGLILTLNSTLVYDHPGAKEPDGSIKLYPHIINKERNVIIRSEDPYGNRGHSFFHSRSDIDIRYSSFLNMGRTNIGDVGSYQNVKSRYPMHTHHLIGPKSPQENGYQFTLIGNVVDFGKSNYDLHKKWGIVIHGSHYGLIEKNIVDHASGAAVITEDGTETGNWFKDNFVVRIVGGNGERTQDNNDKNFYSDNEPDFNDISKLARAGTGFWFNGGGNNFIEGNIVADMYNELGHIYTHAFKFDNIYTGDINIPTKQGDNPHAGEFKTVSSYNVGIKHFKYNEAYGVQSGFTNWWYCSLSSSTPESEKNCETKIENFTVWNFHNWGIYVYPSANILIENFTARGEYIVQYGLVKPSNLAIQFSDYHAKNLTMNNIDIYGVKNGINAPSKVTVNQGDKLEFLPGSTYTLKNSYICANTPFIKQIIWSVGNGGSLGSKRAAISNVTLCDTLFSKPVESHYFLKQKARNNDYNDNLIGRNDMILEDYFYNGTYHDLYVYPNYHNESYCDTSIANCSENINNSFPLIQGGKIHRLLVNSENNSEIISVNTTQPEEINQTNSTFKTPFISIIEIEKDSILIKWESYLNLSNITYSIFKDSIFVDNITIKNYTYSNLSSNTTYNLSINYRNLNNTLFSLNITSNTLEEEIEEEVEKPILSENPEKPKPSSSGGGGGGGSSSSSQKSSLIINSLFSEEKDIRDQCVALFEYTQWTICEDSVQTRIRTDSNSCFDTKTQSRSCKEIVSEEELLFSDSKELEINLFRDKIFTSSFDNLRNFKSKEKIEDVFVVYNEYEEIDYLAEFIQQDENETYYYSLTPIDEIVLSSNILYEENILERTISTNIESNNSNIGQHKYFPVIVSLFYSLLFFATIFAIYFYIKNHSKKSKENSLKIASNHDTGIVHSNPTIQKYKGHLNEIQKYKDKFPNTPQNELRQNLEKVGWNKEILDEVFKK